jgi:hypothetical protein
MDSYDAFHHGHGNSQLFLFGYLRNVLITIFAMALFVLTGYILSVLFGQLFDFISAIIQELGLRG